MSDVVLKHGEEINGTHSKVYLIKDMNVDEFNFEVSGTLIGGQQDLSVSRTKEVREIFHKDCEGGYAKKSGGRNSWSISFSGLVIYGDEGIALVKEIMDGDGKCGVYIETGSELREYGEVILTQNDTTAPNDEEMTYDISAEGTGILRTISKEDATKLKFNLNLPKDAKK